MDRDRLVVGPGFSPIAFGARLAGPLVAGVCAAPTPAAEGPAPQPGNVTAAVGSVSVRSEHGACNSAAPSPLVGAAATGRRSAGAGRPRSGPERRRPALGASLGTTQVRESAMCGWRSIDGAGAPPRAACPQEPSRDELLRLGRDDGPERPPARGTVPVGVPE